MRMIQPPNGTLLAIFRAGALGLLAWNLRTTVSNGERLARLEEHVASIDRMLQTEKRSALDPEP